MASFREQMQRLADNIARTRNERKAFLDRNQKECTRKRRELKDQRNQIKIELEKEAKALSKQLGEFNRNNQKIVEKTLRDLRTVRVKAAKSAKTLLKQEIAKNRRDIGRMLRQNNNDRFDIGMVLSQALGEQAQLLLGATLIKSGDNQTDTLLHGVGSMQDSRNRESHFCADSSADPIRRRLCRKVAARFCQETRWLNQSLSFSSNIKSLE